VACGVSEDVIDAILNRRRSISGTEIEGTAYTFTRELVTTNHIGEATYRKTSRALGIRGVVDLVHLIGIYLTTSALLNAFDVPAPEDVIET
jgi:4-carboxymuconolactone decarboxylase